MERKKKQSQMLSSSIYVWSRKVQLCNEVKNLQYMATSTFYSSAATEYKERDCCWGYQGVGGGYGCDLTVLWWNWKEEELLRLDCIKFGVLNIVGLYL